MVVAVEALPELIQKQWNLVSVGGGPVREIVDGTRRANLFNIKSMILSLGVDKRVYSHSQNRWERVASEFVDFTRAEAMNNDFKDLLGTRPTSEELRAFLAVHGYSDDVKVVEGCPSRPDDPRLEQMMSVSVFDNSGTIIQIHVSPELPGDRRYSNKPDTTNRMQQYILCADGIIRDAVTGLEVNKNELRDEMPSLKFKDDEIADRFIYMSRYILNLVRGLHFINKQGVVDEWMPDVGTRELNDFVAFASSIPYFIRTGKIGNGEIREFRQRMMASYLINPKLFKNLAVAFDMHSVFPFFEDIVKAYKMHEDLTMPKSENELIDHIESTMGNKFDANMSYLANVAKMFGIGQFSWADEVLE